MAYIKTPNDNGLQITIPIAFSHVINVIIVPATNIFVVSREKKIKTTGGDCKVGTKPKMHTEQCGDLKEGGLTPRLTTNFLE